MRVFPKILRKTSKPQQVSLGNIRVASPCPADWKKMVGDERVRHCAECNLNVYNLSAMTERQVLASIAESRGQRLCTRFYRRADGTILTQDCPSSFRAMQRKVSRLGAAILTALMSVTVAMGKNKPRTATCECSQSQQKDSGIKLTVVDQHGLVIPQAEITMTSKSGKETIGGMTGPAGEWTRPGVSAGQYLITVKSNGFRTFSSAIEVRDGMLLGLRIKLPLAEVNQTVEVKAEPVEIMGTTVGILTEMHNSVPPMRTTGGQRSPMNP
ncbi:MAG TPA: carboxypeptidase-like regulatory domain-containing protein [Candidatus Angelobacter sp.]|nr:carboxypeptidase-like regulatory domain-containing protein [Candidatus Angelobacter sp.]